MPDSNSENTEQMTTDKENQEPSKGENETKEVELDGELMSVNGFIVMLKACVKRRFLLCYLLHRAEICLRS